MSERLGWLTSGIATIKVGGTTEPEAMRNYYLVEDALNSVKGSIQQGILSGGGVALLNAAQELINVEGDDYSETLGVKLVAETLILPVKNISENCGKIHRKLFQKYLYYLKGMVTMLNLIVT